MADVTATVRTILTVVDQATGPLRAIQSQFQKFTAPVQGIAGKLKGLGDTTGLSNLGSAFKNAAGYVGGFASSLLKVAAPLAGITGAAGIGGLVAGLHSFIEEGDRLDDTSHKVGVTVEALQALELWGAKSDVAASAMATAMGRLTKKVGEAAGGSEKAGKFFADLGVEITGADGKTRDIMAILPDLSRAFQEMDDPAKRAAAASQIFGKAWQSILPLLMQGPEGLAQAVAEIEKTGKITSEQAANAGKLADAQLLLQKSIHGVANAISAALVPVLLPLVEGLTNWITANRELVATTITGWLANVGAALKGVDWAAWGDRLKTVLGALQKFVELIGGVDKAAMLLAGVKFAGPLATMASTLLGLVGTVAKLAWSFGLFTPVGAVLAAVAAAAYLIYTNWDLIAPVVEKTWAAITEGVATAIDAVKGFAKGVGEWLGGALDAVSAWGKRLADAFAAVWGDVKHGMASALGTIGDVLGPVLEPLKEGAARAWDGVKAAFEAGWHGVEGVIELLKAALGSIAGLLDRVADVAHTVAGFFGTIVEGIQTKLPAAVDTAAAEADAAGKRAEDSTARAERAAARASEAAGAAPPPGIAKPAPEPRGPGPWLPEVVAPPGGTPASGQVDVVITAPNQPPGTRVAATSTGAGVRTRTDVGYSMPQLQPAGGA
jgi:phage-related protein